MPLLSPFQKLNQVQWGGPQPGWPDLEFGQDPEGSRYARTPQGVAGWDPSQGSTPQPDPGVDIGPGSYPGTRRSVSPSTAALIQDQRNIQFLEDYKAKVAEASQRQTAAEADQQQKAGLRMVADLLQKNVKPDEAIALAEMFSPGFQGPTTKRAISQQERTQAGQQDLAMFQEILRRGRPTTTSTERQPLGEFSRSYANYYDEGMRQFGDPIKAQRYAETEMRRIRQEQAFGTRYEGAVGGGLGQLTPVPSPLPGGGPVPVAQAVKEAQELGAGIEASEKKSIADLSALRTNALDLRARTDDFTKPYFGPLHNIWAAGMEKYFADVPELQGILGSITEEERGVRAGLQSLRDAVLRARSGAQINEQEYQRLIRFLPGPELPKSTNRARMQQFIHELDTILAEKRRVQPLTQGRAPTYPSLAPIELDIRTGK